MARHRRLMLLSMFIGCFFLTSSLFAQTKSLKKIHVGVPAISMGNMIIFFTKEAKLFEKHGLDADVVVMSGSGFLLEHWSVAVWKFHRLPRLL